MNILERAIQHWAESSVVFYYPIFASEEKSPEGLKLARRIAGEYGVNFKQQLMDLLPSNSAVVACQSLAVLTWGRLIDPCEIPAFMKDDRREITIAACILPTYTVSKFAEQCEADLISSKIPHTIDEQ